MRRPADFTSKITGLTRLNNSVNGNPRYRVAFADYVGAFVTSSDAGFCYAITNPKYRGDVNVWLTRAGRIENIDPA